MVGEAGGEGMWENSVLFPQFCSEPKTPLKYSLFIKKKKKGAGNMKCVVTASRRETLLSTEFV